MDASTSPLILLLVLALGLFLGAPATPTLGLIFLAVLVTGASPFAPFLFSLY